ncbi:MAG: DUF1499 domain-containing protein [Gemmatimonadota bacterium]|nr:DUF1499 domain-containing protein [Gemmatimonadota bacterium]
MVEYKTHQRGHTDLSALGEEPPLSRIAIIGFALAALAGIAILLAGPGTQWGWWHFRTGFQLLRWGAYLAIVGGLVSAAAIFLSPRTKSRLLAGAGVLIAAVAVFVPWSYRNAGAGVPPIHDISTDLTNPPAFIAVARLRTPDHNPAAYPGEEVAAQQREAYPDIQPLRLALPRYQAFDVALATVHALGWEVVASEREEGRIEATDRTEWFGFEDDVVIRVTSDSGLARVDARSKSRIGGSDVGANARRIRDFMSALRRRVPQAVAE